METKPYIRALLKRTVKELDSLGCKGVAIAAVSQDGAGTAVIHGNSKDIVTCIACQGSVLEELVPGIWKDIRNGGKPPELKL